MKKLIYSKEDLDLILTLELEEKNKEIERLNNQIKEYGDLDNHNKSLYEENKRLNNVINEMKAILKSKGYETYISVLEGSDKE